LTTLRITSPRVTVQRRALAARVRGLAVALFVTTTALSVAVPGLGVLSLAGVGAMVSLFVWARSVSTGATPFAGSLEVSPGELLVTLAGGDRVAVTGVRAGWVVPGTSGARVEFARDDGDVVSAELPTVEDGHAALAAAGIDPSKRALRMLLGGRWDGVGYGVVTALFVLLQGTPMFVLMAVALHLSGATTAALGIALLTLATFLGGHTLGPAELTLGADGLRWKHGFSRGYAAWRDVTAIEAWHDQGVLLKRRRAGHVLIPHSQRDGGHLAGVIELLRRAWERATAARSTPLEALDRQGRTLAAWREALRGLMVSAAYRQGVVTADDLVATLADPSVSAERRLAAAMCLTDAGALNAATHVRVAAEACASEELRVALERAAEGAVDEATAARVTGR
jgi:hypothetical protein